MTAEIAVMNRSGVALAADSAALVPPRKLYNSVNKLFGLSRFHPVGIMVHGIADLAGVPWEVVIKVFRKDLGKRPFATLREYTEALFGFLSGNTHLFPETAQELSVFQLLSNYLVDEVRPEVLRRFFEAQRDKPGQRPLDVVVDEVLTEAESALAAEPFLGGHGERTTLRQPGRPTERPLKPPAKLRSLRSRSARRRSHGFFEYQAGF